MHFAVYPLREHHGDFQWNDVLTVTATVLARLIKGALSRSECFAAVTVTATNVWQEMRQSLD
jgi:hypothetical protein